MRAKGSERGRCKKCQPFDYLLVRGTELQLHFMWYHLIVNRNVKTWEHICSQSWFRLYCLVWLRVGPKKGKSWDWENPSCGCTWGLAQLNPSCTVDLQMVLQLHSCTRVAWGWLPCAVPPPWPPRSSSPPALRPNLRLARSSVSASARSCHPGVGDWCSN